MNRHVNPIMCSPPQRRRVHVILRRPGTTDEHPSSKEVDLVAGELDTSQTQLGDRLDPIERKSDAQFSSVSSFSMTVPTPACDIRRLPRTAPPGNIHAICGSRGGAAAPVRRTLDRWRVPPVRHMAIRFSVAGREWRDSDCALAHAMRAYTHTAHLVERHASRPGEGSRDRARLASVLPSTSTEAAIRRRPGSTIRHGQ